MDLTVWSAQGTAEESFPISFTSCAAKMQQRIETAVELKTEFQRLKIAEEQHKRGRE